MTCNLGSNSPMVGSFMSFNDFQTGSARGSSVLLGGTTRDNYLDIRGAVQNITAPADGDNWTDTHYSIALNDIYLDVGLDQLVRTFTTVGTGASSSKLRHQTLKTTTLSTVGRGIGQVTLCLLNQIASGEKTLTIPNRLILPRD